MAEHPIEMWNSVYDDDTAPWVVGEPQPEIIELERAGWISGRVLDPGAGAGEHTIALTRLGYDVLGIDLSPSAVRYAQKNATNKGVPNARFAVADVTASDFDNRQFGTFDTIVDSALFHVFGTDAEARAAYVRGLHALCKPGGLVHVLALSDTEAGFGPRISDSLIRDSFSEGWDIEDLHPAQYRGRITETIAEEAAQAGLPQEGQVDTAAWRVRIRRH